MKITTPNFNIECTIDELKAMEQCGILAMICQPEPMPAIPFPLPELPTAGGTNETVAKTDIPDENTPEIATAEVKTEDIERRTKELAELDRQDRRRESRGNEHHPSTPIDVRAKGGQWNTYPSISRAALVLGCKSAALNAALKRGKTEYCGCEVRYYQEPTELDKCLSEIEESNREPYECSRPIGH